MSNLESCESYRRKCLRELLQIDVSGIQTRSVKQQAGEWVLTTRTIITMPDGGRTWLRFSTGVDYSEVGGSGVGV